MIGDGLFMFIQITFWTKSRRIRQPFAVLQLPPPKRQSWGIQRQAARILSPKQLQPLPCLHLVYTQEPLETQKKPRGWFNVILEKQMKKKDILRIP